MLMAATTRARPWSSMIFSTGRRYRRVGSSPRPRRRELPLSRQARCPPGYYLDASAWNAHWPACLDPCPISYSPATLRTGDLHDCRAPRRVDRWRRRFRDRRRLSSDDRVPSPELCPSRRAPGDRWHLGPVPVSGDSLRLRHVHLRLPVPALDRAEVHCRRRLNPSGRAPDGARIWHRPPRPPPASHATSNLEFEGCALDRRGRTRRRADPPQLQLSADVQRIL